MAGFVAWRFKGLVMKKAVEDRLRDTELLHAREYHFERLTALFAGEKLDAPFILWGIPGQSQADPYTEPERWLEEALTDLAVQSERMLDRRVFRPLVLECGFYGVRFPDRIFGAPVRLCSEGWWGDGLDIEPAELLPPDWEHSETWHQARNMAEAFMEYQLTVPLFGLPTIASALNVAVNLFGRRFLEGLLIDPDGTVHALRVINDTLCALHRWYQRFLPETLLQPVIAFQRTVPRGYGQLCGCSCHLLSMEQYRDFVAPFDDALLRAYPHGGMIHLCGAHTQHIPTWREMTALRAVQLNDRAADDFEYYFNGLREDQVIYLNPTKTMPACRALEISSGRRLVLVEDRPGISIK